MIENVKNEIISLLKKAGATGDIELVAPPNSEMGDLAFSCFELAKKEGKNPKEVATNIKSKVKSLKSKVIEKVESTGPYVNFTLNSQELAKMLLKEIKNTSYGLHVIGYKKKVLVEFGCPNPLKVFHLGHLKNLITGESVARIFENAGFDVKRVNYQGDVGMHIAKSLFGILEISNFKFQISNLESVKEKVALLGKAYAKGAQAFEEDEEAKKQIVELNKKVYMKDPEIQEIYRMAVKISLEYFDEIYKKLGTGFDKLYMESEVSGPGEKIVREYLKKGVFKESEGAIIFEGSKFGLHDRVFINSEGFPTYEGKDMGLAKMHFDDYDPDRVVHVVGKEQSEYFKVVFKAIGEIWPGREEKEFHLPGGFLQLRGEQKMSSRTGQVISGDELIDFVEEKVREIMKEGQVSDREDIVWKVTVAALKYAMLKVEARKDVAFDIEESVSVAGDSGPYLLYIVARIKSILQKADIRKQISENSIPEKIEDKEKSLLLELAKYPEVTKEAYDTLDPSKIAKYLFGLAQTFNSFYESCPVLKAQEDIKNFRLNLIGATQVVMENGLRLLGIEIVEKM